MPSDGSAISPPAGTDGTLSVRPAPVGPGPAEQGQAPRRARRIDLNNPRHLGPLLVTPIQVLMILVALFPLLAGLYISVLNWLPNLGTEWWDPSTFAGVQNYVDAIVSEPLFRGALVRTFVFVLASVTIEVGLGLVLALLLWRQLRGGGLITALLLIPMLMVPAVVGYTFFMLLQESGPLNAALGWILHHDVAIPWLTDERLALVSIVLMDVWQWTPLMMLIFLAGLASLPDDQLAAARLLHASPLQILRWNVLPMLKPIILVAVIIRSMEALKTFDPILIATGGGPGDSTRLISLHLYKTGFQNLQFSLAAAESFLTLLLVAVAALFALRVFSPSERRQQQSAPPQDGIVTADLSSAERPAEDSALDAAGRARLASASTPRAPRISARKRLRRATAVRYVALTALAVAFLFPVFWITTIAFKPAVEWNTTPITWLPIEPTLNNFRVLFDLSASVGSGGGSELIANTATRAIMNSLIISTLGTLLAMVIGTTAAYAISRFRTGGSALPFNILTLRMMPPIVLLVPLVLMASTFNLIDTHLGLILLYGLFTSPFAVWLMKSFFDEIPREIDEAAMLDGFSTLHTFFRKILPLTKGGLAVTSLFCFILAWSDFALAFLMTRTEAITIPVQLQKYVEASGTLYGPRAALGLIAVLPVAILGLLIRKHLATGLSFGAIKR